LDLDVRNDTATAALVSKLHVVSACSRVDNLQTLVVIDGVIAVIVGLVAAPFILARWRKLQRGNRIGSEVPELRILCQRTGWNERQKNGGCENSGLGHRLLPEMSIISRNDLKRPATHRSRDEAGSVPANVIVHECRYEVIAVIIAGLSAQN